mgnify:CR=1 FL=1|tara:strand:- start:44468 stop:45268 length:801 start_codon:yes stop_codon:yes gene_type:complete
MIRKKKSSLIDLTLKILIALSSIWASLETIASEDNLAIWRKFSLASTTVQEVFLSRTPQIAIYSNGLIVYRNKNQKLHQQVQLTKDEVSELFIMMQQRFGLLSLTNEWLDKELPYAKSIQVPFTENNDKMTIWIGLHTPPSLHSYSTELIKSRSVNQLIAPAWNALFEFNKYLTEFSHPQAQPYIPNRVEIVVQKLPKYMAQEAIEAVEWPIDSIDLSVIKGNRLRGFKTLSEPIAGTAYQFLNKHPVVQYKNKSYLVWIRPLLLR